MKSPLNKKKIKTALVHEGRESHTHFGAVNPPVYRVSTVLYKTLNETLRDKGKRMSYGRTGTPTTQALCEALNVLEGGHTTLLAPSGLCAISGALLSCINSGDHLLLNEGVYAPTRRFCHNHLER